MPKLILMCGPAGSGKSTWIKEHLEEDSQVWVSRDAIRFSLLKEHDQYFDKETQVYNLFVNNIISYLNDDYDVYADATHLTKKSRAKLLKRIPPYLYDELDIIWINVDVSVAIDQNENRRGTRAYVEPTYIRRMYHSFQPPTEKEGFDNIEVIKPKYIPNYY